MNSNARNGKNRSRLSTRKHKDEDCAKSVHSYASDQAKDAEDLEKKFEEIHRLRKYLDLFEALLTEMKKLNNEIQVSKGNPQSMVDHLKGLDKAARSGLPDMDISALYRKLCELTEKLSQFDKLVNRAEKVFSGKTVRNFTKLLDDCEKNMLGLQVGLKEFQYIEVMERKIVQRGTTIYYLNRINELVKSQVENQQKLLDSYERRLERNEDFLLQEEIVQVYKSKLKSEDFLFSKRKIKSLGKRRNSC